MFEAFSVPFLDRLIEQKKDIHFSHDPSNFPGSALVDPVSMTAIAPRQGEVEHG